MKHLPAIAGALLGLAFIAFSLMYFLGMMPKQDPPSAAAGNFMAAMAPTGYLALVKALELIGGICVATPLLRRLGLLLLGPVIVNIIAFNWYFVPGTAGVLHPVILTITALSLYLVWAERAAFLAYLRGVPQRK